MELPFLKKKNQGGGGGTIERDADSSSPDKLIEMVAEELMDAFHRKDQQGFMHALRAFISMMKDKDEDAVS